jgi:hypothetical protein
MSRLPTALVLATALAAAGATAFAQHPPHHAPQRAAPAAPAQTPPSAEQMQQMMQMMGRMTPEQRTQMMQHMGGMGGHGAGQPAADPHAHGGPAARGAAASPSTAAFMEANEKMHREMAIRYTGNADRDFAAAMIPHHQGAIDMARIQLQHGTDPEMRRLAEAVIREQEREIAELRAFLARQR